MTIPNRIRIDRHEFAGAFGDIGTSLPFILAMIPASGADPASVLIMFGAMQLFSAFVYGVPVPAQPLKVVAALVIAEKLDASIMYGAGLSVGIAMLLLTLTGLVDWLARVVPKAVIRGLQFGLGLKLATLALRDYVTAEAAPGYVLAALCFVVTLFLFKSRKFPPALAVVSLGVVYALTFNVDAHVFRDAFGIALPQLHRPGVTDIVQGFLILGLAQIPLSLGNSLLATHQLTSDYYPERKITIRKIGLMYSLMNLAAPFLNGIPACYGSGGVEGVRVFGGRTGGAVLIYGLMFLVVGLFFSNGFENVLSVFPLPVLGVLLFFQGFALAALIRDTADDKTDFGIALLVGLMAVGLPYGFLVGMLVGTALAYLVPVLRLQLFSR